MKYFVPLRGYMVHWFRSCQSYCMAGLVGEQHQTQAKRPNFYCRGILNTSELTYCFPGASRDVLALGGNNGGRVPVYLED